MALPDRLLSWRDRLVSKPGFQRFAARFPLTRTIAERESRAVFDLCAGFVYSQVLAAVVELGLLPLLAERPHDTAELAEATALEPAAMERLLRAAQALGLVAPRQGGRHGLGMKGAALLGNPGAMRMIEHHRILYRDLADPVALLRGDHARTGLKAFWPYATGDRGETGRAVAAYSQLMADSLSLVVEDVLDAFAFGRYRHMLDIGGGTGRFAIAVTQRVPGITATVLDLPGVIAQTRDRVAAEPQAGRLSVQAGDAIAGPIPGGADLMTLIRVLHDHDDPEALAILRNIRAALPPGGTLLIAEPMAGIRGAEAMADAYFGFYLLAMGSGRARRPEEIRLMLETAGFVDIRPLHTRRPLLTSAIEARVPAGARHCA